MAPMKVTEGRARDADIRWIMGKPSSSHGDLGTLGCPGKLPSPALSQGLFTVGLVQGVDVCMESWRRCMVSGFDVGVILGKESGPTLLKNYEYMEETNPLVHSYTQARSGCPSLAPGDYPMMQGGRLPYLHYLANQRLRCSVTELNSIEAEGAGAEIRIPLDFTHVCDLLQRRPLTLILVGLLDECRECLGLTG
ncbi:hypothetical protein VNO77_19877 [Canavalia gladiata]|uniref:Uncharacterized protein n=1 Tax=Canavalia gladiata TaxID=3824 RepID=A0AAN9LNF0_CANGL